MDPQACSCTTKILDSISKKPPQVLLELTFSGRPIEIGRILAQEIDPRGLILWIPGCSHPILLKKGEEIRISVHHQDPNRKDLGLLRVSLHE